LRVVNKRIIAESLSDLDYYSKVGHVVAVHGSGTVWIEPDRVIDGILKTLLAAKIPFCGFDGNVSQEKLNPLEFTSCLMAESRACPALMPITA